MNKQICKRCGSEEVARLKWVNVNTDEIYDAYSGTELEWCFNCEDETTIIDCDERVRQFYSDDFGYVTVRYMISDLDGTNLMEGVKISSEDEEFEPIEYYGLGAILLSYDEVHEIIKSNLNE